MPGVVVHAFNPSTWEAEEGGFLSLTETGFLCIVLAVLELTWQPRLASNSEICLLLHPKCWD